MSVVPVLLPVSLAQLRAIAAPAPLDLRVLPFGLSEIDDRLGGGLRAGALHEVAPGSAALADDAAATLFLAGIAAREARRLGSPVLWVSSRVDLYAPGLAQAGLAAADVIYARPRDEAALLAVIEDAVRDGTPAAVIGEIGRMPIVAARRLQLAAADADLPVLLLRRRRSRDHDPLAEPSAAWTRWRVGAASSAKLAVAGVGHPRWTVELARQRSGQPFSLIVEGCDATGRLAVPAGPGHRAAETAGPVRAAAA